MVNAILLIFACCNLTRFSEAFELFRIVLIAESAQPEINGWFNDSINEISNASPDLMNLQGRVAVLNREDEEESYQNICKILSEGVSIVVDTSWSPWHRVLNVLNLWNIPVVSTNVCENATPLDGILQFLYVRGSVDVVIIFEEEKVLETSLYKIISNTILRVMVMTDIENKILDLNRLRPIPSYIVVMGKTQFLADTYKLADSHGLVNLPDRWILCATDLKAYKLDVSILKSKTLLLSMTTATSCILQGQSEPCIDDDSQFKIEISLLNIVIQNLMEIFLEVNFQTQLFKADCSINVTNKTDTTIDSTRLFYDKLFQRISNDISTIYHYKQRRGLYHRAELIIQENTAQGLHTVAKWFSDTSIPEVNVSIPKRFFRIGTTASVPWTYPKIDPATGKNMLTSNGELIYEGYCIDVITRLAEIMDFDYETVSPRAGNFGQKLNNGTWNGLIGDLVDGTIDFAVAALIMTSQREEVVDFIAPYFDQSGFTIVIRKPVKKTSLFKFMTVLRVEVWLSIVASLTITAILLTVLDYYSPYSARNNKGSYLYPAREFTIKESLWFALTSFTPQGGGEAPKSLSGRTLVAAYWLFVVLMLATFTANLAAFLTVERLQSPVSSLEQLARQSRINYTVVEGSPAHFYFLNMKNAEDILYRLWKEITLNASSDELQYQVWDYPIKEQYGHILLAINESQPLPNAVAGFNKVNERENSDFAFIHDSSEIKYEVAKNCNLTMVGEVFGERPYAIAIQQGSRIQEEIAQALLEMQKMRFLDDLAAKYWNNTCPDTDDSEGITLDSLGGVFIATLFGLALAMVTLVWEIFYYKRIDKTQKKPGNQTLAYRPKSFHKKISKIFKKNKRNKNKIITIGETFKPAKKPNVDIIYVTPRLPYNP